MGRASIAPGPEPQRTCRAAQRVTNWRPRLYHAGMGLTYVRGAGPIIMVSISGPGAKASHDARGEF